MSLTLRKLKVIGRRAKFTFRRVKRIDRSWSEGSENRRVDEYRIDYGDPEVDDYETATESTVVREELGTGLYLEEEVVSLNGYARTIASVREWTETVDGVPNDFTIADYTTEVREGNVITIQHRSVRGESDTSTTTSYEVEETEYGHTSEGLTTSTSDVTATLFNETKTQEIFDGLDFGDRYLYSADDTTYRLDSVVDNADLLRDAVGLTAKEFTYRLLNRDRDSDAESFMAGEDSEVDDYSVYYQTVNAQDSGERRWRIKPKAFSDRPIRFEDAWAEIPDGGSFEPERTIVSETLYIVSPDVDSETREVFRIPAYTLSVHEDNGSGGFMLTKFEVAEEKETAEGFSFADEDTIFISYRTFKSPAIEKRGKYSRRFVMIDRYYGTPQVTVRKRAVGYLKNEEDETTTSTEANFATATAWSVSDGEEEGIEFNNVIYFTIEMNQSATREEVISTSVSWNSAVSEQWEDVLYGAVELQPFPMAIVQECHTPGYRPFGQEDTGELFHTFESKVVLEDFGETPADLRFDFPDPRLNGELRRGQSKLDLNDLVYESVVTKRAFKFQRKRRGGAPEFKTFEETDTLTRIAKVTLSWEYPEDGTAFSIATLNQNVRDSDGFNGKRRIEFRLKEPIPRAEHTGHELLNPLNGWAVVNGDSDATLHYGRCMIHVAEVSTNGERRDYNVSAAEAATVKLRKGTSVNVRIERLWMPLGKLGGSPVMTRGSLYLHS